MGEGGLYLLFFSLPSVGQTRAVRGGQEQRYVSNTVNRRTNLFKDFE